jgi:hypothetical protein
MSNATFLVGMEADLTSISRLWRRTQESPGKPRKNMVVENVHIYLQGK